MEHALDKKPITAHIGELRIRLFFYLIGLAFFTILSYKIYGQLIEFLTKPLGQPIYFTSPTGGFSLVLSVSLLFGFLFSLPLLVFHLYRFVEPVLPRHSAKLLLIFITSSSGLMLTGIAFAYYVSLPTALAFLSGFGQGDAKSLITSSEYFTFISRYLLGFGLIFQLPVFLFLLNYISPLSIKTLILKSKYVLVISFIVAAILTPTPDPINQAIMGLPIIILYYLSIFVVFAYNKVH